jgi:hypothetical protein
MVSFTYGKVAPLLDADATQALPRSTHGRVFWLAQTATADSRGRRNATDAEDITACGVETGGRRERETPRRTGRPVGRPWCLPGGVSLSLPLSAYRPLRAVKARSRP